MRYLSWEDAFDVEFEDGLCVLEPHSTIRRANKISLGAKFDRLEIEDWTLSGFFGPLAAVLCRRVPGIAAVYDGQHRKDVLPHASNSLLRVAASAGINRTTLQDMKDPARKLSACERFSCQ